MSDVDNILTEIKRRATRTDLLLYLDGSVGGDQRRGNTVECICITEDALREALAPLCDVVQAAPLARAIGALAWCVGWINAADDGAAAYPERELKAIQTAFSVTPSQEPTE